MKAIFIYTLPLFILMAVSCKKKPEPSVTTLPVTELASSSVVCHGTASGDDITETGICWNTLGQPTINNNREIGEGENFSVTIKGLEVNNTYYARAYCRTKTMLVYGSTIIFKTTEQPTVSTTLASSLTTSSFISGGNIDSKGKTVLSAGVCWSVNHNPTVNDSKQIAIVAANVFNCTASGLDSNQVYFYRSYAVFAEETVYGEEKEVRTFTGMVRDASGNLYYSVTIGGQVWLTSNLRTTRYNNGTSISYYTSQNWDNIPTSTGVYGRYNNVNQAAEVGLLYNYGAVLDSRGIAPAGWRVPTRTDWQILDSYLGNPFVAAGIKSTSPSHWYNSTENTNYSGFSAVGAGYRSSEGIDMGFMNEAQFWSKTIETSSGGLMAYIARIDGSYYMESSADKSYGLSVRCIKE